MEELIYILKSVNKKMTDEVGIKLPKAGGFSLIKSNKEHQYCEGLLYGADNHKVPTYGNNYLVITSTRSYCIINGNSVLFRKGFVTYFGDLHGAVKLIGSGSGQNKGIVYEARSEVGGSKIISGYSSAQITGNGSQMFVGDKSSQYGGANVVQTAGKSSTQYAKTNSTQISKDNSVQVAGYGAVQKAGNFSLQLGGAKSQQLIGSSAYVICGDRSTQVSGGNTVHIVGNECWVKTADGSVVLHKWRDENGINYKLFEVGLDHDRKWCFYENGKVQTYGDKVEKENM